jgi:hypothetical protein
MHQAFAGRQALSSVLVAVAFLLLCLFVQGSTGAWDASFDSYPDEAGHFVGAVMVHDYLASGLSSNPSHFAQQYYNHYPFFGIGYWPPLFYILTGLWFLVAGVGRFQALLVSAAAVTGMAWVLYGLVRKRAGLVAGFCAGILFLSLPEVQRWMCAVMVDEMVGFFCLAAAVLLLRYLDEPSFRNAILCGVCCACATLTKYSGAYVCVLPLAACICLRRFSLLRKPSFWAQYLVMMLLIGPWALWTAKLEAVGLPRMPPPIAKRIGGYLLDLFRIFPPVLAAVVILGVLALLVMPRVWGADLVITGLLCVGCFAFVILAPVAPESRYLLVPCAGLLELSFAGWVAALEPLTRRGPMGAWTVPALAVILTLCMAAAHLRNYDRPPEYSIRSVVEAIVGDPAWADKRIIVSPDLEGPMIAEFALRDHHRPGYHLLRPSKLFAEQGWFGEGYTSRFQSSDEMMAYLRRNPVDLIVWRLPSRTPRKAHVRYMDEMLSHYPLAWQRVASFDSASGALSSWMVYKFVPGKMSAVNLPTVLESRQH